MRRLARGIASWIIASTDSFKDEPVARVPNKRGTYAKVFHPFKVAIDESDKLKSNKSYDREGF